MKNANNFYINGEWVTASQPNAIKVINPATEEVITRIAKGDASDVDQAVAAARSAFEQWSAMPSSERAELLGKLARKMGERLEDMGALISSEQGMPEHLANKIQAGGPTMATGMYAEMCNLMDKVDIKGNTHIVREPIGVCGFITPWNYPLHQIIGKVAPALAAGCTMVLKPSVETPLNAILFTEILDEVGFPPGVFNLVNGSGSVVGEAISAHPDIDMVSFTGSTWAGTRVAEVAAKTVKRVTLELGGKSACIITPDAPLKQAVEKGVQSIMINCGQTCTAKSRMLVHHSQYEEAVEIARQTAESISVGNPTSTDSYMGPVVSQKQLDDILGFVQKGLDEGARLVTGGKKAEGFAAGYYIEPTVFADVDNQMTIAREEIFGPVLCLIPYQDIDEAVSIANDSPYGLSGEVWADSDDNARAIALRLRTGMVHVNGGSFTYESPFGGYKTSGNGREWGEAGLEEFVEIKSLFMPAS
ncbi:aldehyde dehydrogenase [Endozoicomonas montiporae]|uniref:Aldehyde dehydrogenase n=2 Tax=Endozoicomonas montiporae TaxID=1027273 RepID=A0A081N4U5_9GAMM|nr:aldehyde dehydrogenase family protein [Endozoicomonas montiporae]AMO57660.1 aldehyde dehydrogenase [Endozoicomonas montiporae CL-33]KEQ13468.1 aldehyde dehydrogenase [Endozoicomonas montiporae]